MPDEALISEIENILSDVVALGGENEQTSIVPNLTVQDADPAGLSGFIIVSDDRDGDNILAKKVGSVVYANNDLVNVIFVQGGEAIAFQQGSQSSNNGIWEIVSGTSTDIYYDKGDVGIGKSVAPDAALEVLAASQAQLRLTHTEDTKFAGFTLDTNHDLTITPSSTGQIILQPTTDSVDFFQVLDADGGDPVVNVNSTDEALSVKTANSSYVFQAGSPTQATIWAEDADAPRRRTIVLNRSSDTAARGGQSAYLRSRLGPAAVQNGDAIGAFNFESHDGTDYNMSAQFRVDIDGAVSANTVPGNFIIKTTETNNAGLTDRLHITSAGLIGIGNVTSPLAQLHIDQRSTSAAIPVLYLDQADVDEPFTKYVGTAAAATLTRSIVAEADVTTATRQGFVKIEIEDIGNQVTDQDYFVAFYTLA